MQTETASCRRGQRKHSKQTTPTFPAIPHRSRKFSVRAERTIERDRHIHHRAAHRRTIVHLRLLEMRSLSAVVCRRACRSVRRRRVRRSAAAGGGGSGRLTALVGARRWLRRRSAPFGPFRNDGDVRRRSAPFRNDGDVRRRSAPFRNDGDVRRSAPFRNDGDVPGHGFQSSRFVVPARFTFRKYAVRESYDDMCVMISLSVTQTSPVAIFERRTSKMLIDKSAALFVFTIK